MFTDLFLAERVSAGLIRNVRARCLPPTTSPRCVWTPSMSSSFPKNLSFYVSSTVTILAYCTRFTMHIAYMSIKIQSLYDKQTPSSIWKQSSDNSIFSCFYRVLWLLLHPNLISIFKTVRKKFLLFRLYHFQFKLHCCDGLFVAQVEFSFARKPPPQISDIHSFLNRVWVSRIV